MIIENKSKEIKMDENLKFQLPKLRVASSNLVFRSLKSRGYDESRNLFSFFLAHNFTHKVAAIISILFEGVSTHDRLFAVDE